MPPILYEDDDLIIVDKPAGVAAHGGSGVLHGMIERARAARPQQAFLELAHRLDRETSGILMLAKTRRALQSLHEQLREGHVEKRYLLLVAGDWVNDRQHVRLPLTKFVNRAGERRVAIDPEGVASHTIFTLKQRLGAFTLLEAELKTGRTHQIRVHVAHLGFPIAGDDKYGDFELNRRLARGEFGVAIRPHVPARILDPVRASGQRRAARHRQRAAGRLQGVGAGAGRSQPCHGRLTSSSSTGMAPWSTRLR